MQAYFLNIQSEPALFYINLYPGVNLPNYHRLIEIKTRHAGGVFMLLFLFLYLDGIIIVQHIH